MRICIYYLDIDLLFFFNLLPYSAPMCTFNLSQKKRWSTVLSRNHPSCAHVVSFGSGVKFKVCLIGDCFFCSSFEPKLLLEHDKP